jgi:hypothetical protein
VTMLVPDALFDHIHRISSDVEILGSLASARPFRQLMSELGHFRPSQLDLFAGALPFRLESRLRLGWRKRHVDHVVAASQTSRLGHPGKVCHLATAHEPKCPSLMPMKACGSVYSANKERGMFMRSSISLVVGGLGAALLIMAALPVLVVPAVAQDKTFTCQVQGISFVLDDNDFTALKDANVTREKFVSFPPGSAQRANVCETRRIARLVKAGKIGYCDFVTLKYWRGDYLSESEALLVFEAQNKTEPKGAIPKCP